MSDHLDFIRIYGLSDGDAEVFQGVRAALTSGSITPPTTPKTPAERESVVNLDKLWSAQTTFTANLAQYLGGLDPQTNTDEGSLIQDYIKVLTTSNDFQASLEALGIQKDLLDTLPKIWETISRQTPKELQKWINDSDEYSTQLENWFVSAMDAAALKRQAEDDLADATTPEQIAAAQEALASATIAEAEADGELPDTNPISGVVAVIAIARALMTGQIHLALIIAVRMFVPMLIDLIVKWVKGKLPGSQPTRADVKKLVQALQDIALKDAVIKFGDNASLHLKAELLEY